MNASTILFEILRYTTMTFDTLWLNWNRFLIWYYTLDVRPKRRYYLSEVYEFDPEDEVVPEECVYVEEWINEKGEKKCIVRYEGDPIPQEWNGTPFDVPAQCPWLWIGDKTTEIDLTRAFHKFLVPGNEIRMELVEQLIHITESTDLIYIELGTFKDQKFPDEGILIKAVENE
jgi:hypothetical protein